MKRNKKMKTMQETLSTIDGALVALNSYPNLEDALLEKAQNQINRHLNEFFPTQLDFSKSILEHLVGTDAVIDIVSKFLIYALPGVEVGLKATLLSNMVNLGVGCDIDPIIYEKAIKEGVVFDLKQIDLYDKLTISPLDRKYGKYFYFGTEGCESSYDILQSAINPSEEIPEGATAHISGSRKRDFDCLLWYMKNKSIYREVWGKKTTKGEDIFQGGIDTQSWVDKFGDNKTCYYEIRGNKVYYFTSKGSPIQKPVDTTLKPLVDGKKYLFDSGGKLYICLQQNYNYKLLDKSKIYVSGHKGSNTYDVYRFNGTKWFNTNINGIKSYKDNTNLPTDLKMGDSVIIGDVFYIVTSKPTVNKTSIIDRVGTKKEETVLTKYGLERCEDITNFIKLNTTVFIDDEKKVTDIKNGISVLSVLGDVINIKTTLGWTVVEYNKNIHNDVIQVPTQDVYYEKKTIASEPFNPKVDIIHIKPRYQYNGKVQPCFAIRRGKDERYTKDFGILTLEFSPRTGNVKQSDGKPMQQQTPYDNVLHVFFGNVKELPTSDRGRKEGDLRLSSDVNRLGVSVYDKMLSIYEKHNNEWKKKLDEWKKMGTPNGNSVSQDSKLNEAKAFNVASNDYYIFIYGNQTLKRNLDSSSSIFDDINGINSKLVDINNLIDSYLRKLGPEYSFDYSYFKEFETEILKVLNGFSIWAYSQRAAQIMSSHEDMMLLSANNAKYPEANKNYYLRKTLYEFNVDYINSLQLFDAKVLASQMITTLFGGLTTNLIVGATSSWKTELIRDTVTNLVEKTIASEDLSISDCFFTFSNDVYNDMLRASELRQAGLYSKHGEVNGNSSINPLDLLSNLNEIDKTTDKESNTSIIKGVIIKASEEVSKDVFKENSYLSVNAHYGVQKSFIDMLITNLCTQLVMSILSPKVYLLILINLEMYGLSTNFDIKSFIERFHNLIRGIIKSIVDQFMQYMSQEIMRHVEEMVQKLSSELMFEQAEMYARLLKQILSHLRMLTSCGDGYGWTQDKVGTADIRTSDNREPVNEC